MAKKKKSTQNKNSVKRINLSGYVETKSNKFIITVTAITRNDQMVIAGNQDVTLYDEKRHILETGSSNAMGVFQMIFTRSIEEAGAQIIITGVLDGTKSEDTVIINLPTPNKGRQLKLYPGETKEVNGKFILPLEVIVAEPNETSANNIEVEFIDFNNKVFATLSTVNGKAGAVYVFPLKHSEKTLKFRCRIKGTAHEAPPEIVTVPKAKYANINYRKSVLKYLKGLEKDKFPGFNPLKYKKGSCELIKANLAKETKVKLFSKVAVMYLVAAVMLYILQMIGLRWSAIPISIAIIFGVAFLPGKFTLGLGSVYAGIFFAISMLVPELTVGAISSAAYMYLIMGPPTYLYEKLSRKDDGSKNNIYPWLMIKFCWIVSGFYIVYGVHNLILDHNVYLDSIRGFLENEAIKSYAKNAMVAGAHEVPKIKHIYAYALEGKMFLMSIVMAASWIFASVIIFIPTSFGEFKDYLELKITGKGKAGASASHVGIYFLLDTLLERVIRRKI